MADRSGNLKFVFRAFPGGSLIVWGIPGNFDFSQTPTLDQLKIWIEERRILRFWHPELHQGVSDFFQHLRRGILHWFEEPWVFLSSDDIFREKTFDGRQILVVPEASAPTEIRFIEKIEALKGSPHLPQSEYLPKEKLLLHVCCGPDAAGVVKQLKENFDLTCFWYDPNIQPREEYDKRLEAFRKVMTIYKIPFIEGEYDVERFDESIRGLEWTPEQGAKCSVCYDMRLERSARLAKEIGFPSYATTLAISPHKVQQKLQKFGDLNFKTLGVRYYHKAFHKNEGFNESVEFTKQHDIFRQDYCGCLYSLHEGGPEARQTAKRLGYLPPGKAPTSLLV